MAADTGLEWVPKRMLVPQEAINASQLRTVRHELLVGSLLVAGIVAIRPIAVVSLWWLFWPAVLCWLISVPAYIDQLLKRQKPIYLKFVVLPFALAGVLLAHKAAHTSVVVGLVFIAGVLLASLLTFVMAREYMRYLVRTGDFNVDTKRIWAQGMPWKFAIIVPAPFLGLIVAAIVCGLSGISADHMVPAACWTFATLALFVTLIDDQDRKRFFGSLGFWFTYNRAGRKPPNMHQLHEPFDRVAWRQAAVVACLVFLAFAVTAHEPLPEFEDTLYVTVVKAFTTRADVERTQRLRLYRGFRFLFLAPLPPLMLLSFHAMMTIWPVRTGVEHLEKCK